MNNCLRIFCFVCLLFISINCFATNQNEKLWLGVNALQPLSNNKKWLYFIFSQLRFINKSHPWQVGLVEGGIGYRLTDQGTLWAGYRWSGHHPNNGFFQENRLFQQWIAHRNVTSSHRVISRVRLEETERGDSSQISIRLRQRVALELKRDYLSVFPFLYDEVFFQLKNTDYTSNKFVNENRVFIGFNLYTSHKTWWEIGYINQYEMRRPQQTQNSMSHIVSLVYNIS